MRGKHIRVCVRGGGISLGVLTGWVKSGGGDVCKERGWGYRSRAMNGCMTRNQGSGGCWPVVTGRNAVEALLVVVLQGMVGLVRRGGGMDREESSKQGGRSDERIQPQKSSTCPLLRWPAYRPADFV